MSTNSMGLGAAARNTALTLEYPMSLATYATYPEAQKAVDLLSDKQFPVENCLIVGSDLKQIERVTGRLTWSKVITAGILSGAWFGLFIGLIFSLFVQNITVWQVVIYTALWGAVFGLIWSAIGYAFTRGQRDFSSVSAIVPSSFELLVEHKFAQQAGTLLDEAGLRPNASGFPGTAATPIDPSATPPTA
ncbi:general stress protein [Branchiibius cervicis]|uniref:General stress protein n=1 Tax=Branchiibius cervicis TaxID=908252 RepID=A0ABW2ASL4_9MICO